MRSTVLGTVLLAFGIGTWTVQPAAQNQASSTKTLVTGGKLRDEKRTNAGNLSGSGIDDGMSREIAKGDLVIVPENTPHWFRNIAGTLVLMSMRVPRGDK